MNLIQLKYDGLLRTGIISGETIDLLPEGDSLYKIIIHSIEQNLSFYSLLASKTTTERLSVNALPRKIEYLPPLTHPNLYATWAGGSGLTHPNRAFIRKKMELSEQVYLNDSQKIYYDGLQNGKPKAGEQGARPEWFFKGHGDNILSHQHDFRIPTHDLGGGEESEIVVVYYIDKTSQVHRIGICLGNEFADHVLEKKNHFYISQCKLRPFSVGCEIILGECPEQFSLTTSVYRENQCVWQASTHTGEANMNHSFANIETHLFQHSQLRRPDTVYYHFMGAANISYSDGFIYQHDDTIEINSSSFWLPLSNRICYQWD